MNEQYLICTFLFLIMHSDQVILIRVSETHFLIEFYFSGFSNKVFIKKLGENTNENGNKQESRGEGGH